MHGVKTTRKPTGPERAHRGPFWGALIVAPNRAPPEPRRTAAGPQPERAPPVSRSGAGKGPLRGPAGVCRNRYTLTDGHPWRRPLAAPLGPMRPPQRFRNPLKGPAWRCVCAVRARKGPRPAQLRRGAMGEKVPEREAVHLSEIPVKYLGPPQGPFTALPSLLVVRPLVELAEVLPPLGGSHPVLSVSH